MHLEIKMYRLRDLVTSLAIFGRKQCSAGSGVVGTIKLAFVGFAASVFIVSCEKQEGDNGTLLAKQNQAELESLKAQLAQMRETNQNLSMSISAAFVMMHDYQSVGHEAVFDGNRPGGVVRLNTDSGFFLVSFKDAQPYLEGYRVTVELGNPLAADYDNAEIHVAWGGSEPSAYNEVLTNANALQKFNNAYQTWKNSLHSNDIPIPGRLFAGKWNKIQLVLSPAKPSDLGYVRIKLDTPSVSLKTAPQ
jgi:hypothetical protein